jgi:hypothetical protein
MNFPFDMQSVLETMTDRPLVRSNNLFNEYTFLQEVVLSKDGTATNGKWEVVDGVLRLLSDKGHLVTEYRTVETRNGAVYAIGRDVLGPNEQVRSILHIKKPLGNDFGVVVSSHVNYEKLAIPRILHSLEGDGFDMNKVVVVIGNDKVNDGVTGMDSTLKVMSVRTRKDIFGMTALNSIPDASTKPYWLLLHDTCEVTNGFTKNIANIDIGLNPNMVAFRPLNEKIEFGLYQSGFISLCTMPMGTKPFNHFEVVTKKAGIISILGSPFKKEPEKDVYGKGIVREVVNFNALGFRKYKAKASDSRRP